MRTNTRPTMLDSLIGPFARASCELVRLSPITKTLPAGTLQPPSGLPFGPGGSHTRTFLPAASVMYGSVDGMNVSMTFPSGFGR